MKKINFLLLFFSFLIINGAYSQDTLRLFGHRKIQTPPQETRPAAATGNPEFRTITGSGHSLGFVIGFGPGYSRIAGSDAFEIGGEIGMIANHGLTIGFAGRGFFTEPYTRMTGSAVSYNYAGGYGGLLVEPSFFPGYPVHFSVPILLGGGGIAENTLTNFYYPYDYTDVYVDHAEAFFVAEPGLELEMNVARWFRIGIRGSYRFTSRVDPKVFTSAPLNGFTGGFSLKFGKF
jgi:hypothetical protein